LNAEGFGETPPRVACRTTPPATLPTSPKALPATSPSTSPGALLRRLLACALLLALPAALPAQDTGPDAELLAGDPQTMTVEELERYIAEQKAQLEQVRENRDITAEEARRVREELARQEAERRVKAAELEALCREREALEPGSLEECLSRIDGEQDR